MHWAWGLLSAWSWCAPTAGSLPLWGDWWRRARSGQSLTGCCRWSASGAGAAAVRLRACLPRACFKSAVLRMCGGLGQLSSPPHKAAQQPRLGTAHMHAVAPLPAATAAVGHCVPAQEGLPTPAANCWLLAAGRLMSTWSGATHGARWCCGCGRREDTCQSAPGFSSAEAAPHQRPLQVTASCLATEPCSGAFLSLQQHHMLTRIWLPRALSRYCQG